MYNKVETDLNFVKREKEVENFRKENDKYVHAPFSYEIES